MDMVAGCLEINASKTPGSDPHQVYPTIIRRTHRINVKLSAQLLNMNLSMQGIIDMNRNGNSANFFSYVRNDKKSKELFASF